MQHSDEIIKTTVVVVAKLCIIDLGAEMHHSLHEHQERSWMAEEVEDSYQFHNMVAELSCTSFVAQLREAKIRDL